jgi:hypothetical protein
MTTVQFLVTQALEGELAAADPEHFGALATPDLLESYDHILQMQMGLAEIHHKIQLLGAA